MADFGRPARFAAVLAMLAGAPVAAAAQALVTTPPTIFSAPDAPVAQLRIFSSNRVESTWHGEGTNAVSADLCVASTTGRVRLTIVSQGGGQLVGGADGTHLAYTVRFRDGSGVEQVKKADGKALLTFEANSPQPDCTAGANATLEIDTSEGDMLAQSAGQYFDRLMLSVEPL